MEHVFYWNKESFPSHTKEDGIRLVLGMLQGMLAVGMRADRYAIFSDGSESLKSNTIFEGYTFGDFVKEIGKIDPDFQLALDEIDDKTPVLEFMSDSELEEISEYSFYFPDEGYTSSNDTLAFAWFLGAILLSIPSKPKWDSGRIEFERYLEGDASAVAYYINNISQRSHGVGLKAQFESGALALENLAGNCKFSSEFSDWYNELSKEKKSNHF